MDKEIEKMAKITGLCDYTDVNCEQCRLKHNMHLCMHREAMKKLTDAGYGDIKQAKQEFADQLYDKVESCAMCFGRNPERDAGVYLTDIKQAIKELLEG